VREKNAQEKNGNAKKEWRERGGEWKKEEVGMVKP
jgi:hypothetical protein